MAKNAYIHIPFCKSKCNYCSFVSFSKLELRPDYLKSLKQQIESEYKNEALKTLYFGGGTPSLLTIEEFREIFELFNLEDYAEITVEVNPESADLKYLTDLRKAGVNRLSMGVQTFDDDILKLISRAHTSDEAITAFNSARKARFKNISIDLIYGLPTQTVNGFESDLEKAVSLNPEHISLYGLKIEEGCYFYDNSPKSLPDLDLQADMYLKAIEVLKKSGFTQYEISNFARKEHESRHNLNYWDNNTYYGFGCAASGYIDGVRYTNETDLNKYISNTNSKISSEKLSKQEILEEEIFLGFRKSNGIDKCEINQKFGIDFESKYSNIIKKYSKFIEKTPRGYKLNTQGILISNDILSEFIE